MKKIESPRCGTNRTGGNKMKLLKRLFLVTAIGAVLMLSAFSADCHQLTEEWFGDSGSEVSVLSIAALEPTDPDIESALDAYFSVREAQFTPGGYCDLQC